MADDGNLKFTLDLDNQGFMSGANAALGVIKDLGASDSLTGLIEGLEGVGAILSVVGVAVYAFKAALDLTEEGEEVQRIQDQFSMLADQAGVNGAAIQEGMEQASRGLISTTDQLKIANKALVTMGSDAAQLPELMELARKASLVMGGDLTTNFTNIANAVETGNQRMLRRLGLNVDVTAAEQKFAASLGVTRGELSKQGQQHAILLAVIEKSHTAFSGVVDDQDRTVDAVTRAKVAWNDLKEVLAVLVSTELKPTFSSFFSSVTTGLHNLKNSFESEFGTGTKSASASLEILQNDLKRYNAQVDQIKSGKRSFFDFIIGGDVNSRLSVLKDNIATTQAAIAALETKKKEADKEEQVQFNNSEAGKKAAHDRDMLNEQARLKTTAAVDKELLKLEQETTKQESLNVRSIGQVDALVNQQMVDRAKSHVQALKQINTTYGAESSRAGQLRMAENDRFEAQERAEALNTAKVREQLMAQYVRTSVTAFQGITRAAQEMGSKSSADLKDMGKLGEETMTDFKKNSTAAFQQIGQGIAAGASIAQAAADAMKGFFLNMLGDRATAAGLLMVGESVWPPNPLALAGGGALIALGATLKGLAGSSGGSSISGGSAGGGGGSASAAAPAQAQAAASPAQAAQQQAQAQPQQNLTVNVQGHYFDTQQTQRQVGDLFRGLLDQTGYQPNLKIGQTG